jgi:6-phosphogluconate dehydrogenase
MQDMTASLGLYGLGTMGRGAGAQHPRARASRSMWRTAPPPRFPPSSTARARSPRAPRGTKAWPPWPPRCPAPRVILMVDAGPRWTRRSRRSAGSPPGDTVVDCGNADFHDTRRRAADLEARGLTYSRRRRLGRRGGRAPRPRDHGGGGPRPGRISPPSSRPSPAKYQGKPCAALMGPGRGGPLRQDRAQRHRIRRHAAHRRGLRPPAPRHGPAPGPIGDLFAGWDEGGCRATSWRSAPPCCGRWTRPRASRSWT